MLQKKKGPEDKWSPFIKKLDRIGGRGPQGATKSPLLWEEGQAESLLAGSPVIGQIKERIKGIRKEFEELDTVWYMSGSLFSKYPFEVPSEQFTVERFIQAFAAVQSSVVHLQGVPLSKRFALVPLGPPLLAYSSTCKGLLKYNAEEKAVVMEVDKHYSPGEQIFAWCGPQPNSCLLLNYALVCLSILFLLHILCLLHILFEIRNKVFGGLKCHDVLHEKRLSRIFDGRE